MLSSLFLFVSFLISLISTVRAVCPNGWTKWDDDCYKLYQGKASWLEASSMCREFGGHLATLNTTTRITNAKSFLQDVAHHANVWVGANDIRSESMWKWDVDQSNFMVTDWAPTEPNHGSSENCLMLLASKGYRWADAPCTIKNDYLCNRKSTPI